MAVFNGTNDVHNNLPKDLGDGKIAWAPTLLLVGLSDAQPDPATHTRVSDLPAGPAVGNGYSRDNPPNVAWNQSGAQSKLESDPAVFTAAGGQITATHWWAAYFDTDDANSIVLQSGYLNDAQVPVTVEDTDSITITPHPANGWNDITVS